MATHTKHAKITRRNIGHFHSNEFAILGTPCGNIKKLAFEITSRLTDKYKVGYVDADHKNADEDVADKTSALSYGSTKEYVDKINFHRFDQKGTLNEFDFRTQFDSQDLVLINGNHFRGNQQIIVIDSKKPLEKKLAKLTNVVLILFQDGEGKIPQYLIDSVEGIDNLPRLSLSNYAEISEFVQNQTSSVAPQLKGLVMAGGKSIRMQRDKGKIVYHQSEQRLHMYEILSQLTRESYISIRPEQGEEFSNDTNIISDVYSGLGPYGAILSAFQNDPNAAWIVTACDQPLLNKEVLELLISKRNVSKYATCFYNSETDFPEPLITIWEPRAYSRLLYFLSLGYSCPRKVLINSEIELIKLEDESVLKNANTPEEFEMLNSRVNRQAIV